MESTDLSVLEKNIENYTNWQREETNGALFVLCSNLQIRFVFQN